MKKQKKDYFLCSVWMDDQSLNFFSTVNFLPVFENVNNSYIPWIPGWRIKRKISKSEYSIFYSPSARKLVYYNNKSLIVKGPIREFLDGQALAYLIFWLLEEERQYKGIFTAHGAAISRSKGILVLGERASGKTAISLSLCLKYGYKLMANDLVMIGYNRAIKEGMLYNGTKIIGLRLVTVRENFPYLLSKFNTKNRDSRYNKIFLSAKEMGIKIEIHPKKLSKVFMVYLDATKKDTLTVEKLDGFWIKNYLYENFSRYIRATAIMAFGAKNKDFLGYLPSLDNLTFHNNRIALINYLVNDLKIVKVSGGNLEKIAQYINRVVEK